MRQDNMPKGMGKGRLVFLLFVLLAYLVAGIVEPSLIIRALKGFGQMAVNIVPILLMVFSILLAINMFLKQERIRTIFGREAGAMGWFYAVVGGILISGPPFVLYPMLAEFRKHGAHYSLITVFLYNRNVKIPFLPVMAYYFGLAYTVAISGYIILFSLLSGWLMGLLFDRVASEDMNV